MGKENIIGRIREQELLEDYTKSGKAEFIAIYGRHRIGKTYLVKQFFDGQFDFYMTGIYNRSKSDQLANFTYQLNKYSGGLYPPVSTWFDAFTQLQHFIETRKDKEQIILFIDELPWLDPPRSKFISALELFWNEWASGINNLKFIVCGSATTWMTNKLLGDKGGLHNRVTRQMRLRSFTLGETEQYLLKAGFQPDRIQMLEAYMTLGGTPYYLSMLNPRLSITQNIDELFFAESAPLREEYAFLFRSLFKDSPIYKRIVELLATKVKGMTRMEIIKVLKIPDNGNLSEILDNLCKCDFIRSYSAFGKRERDVLYQLVDLYSLFYVRYVRNDRSGDIHRWSHTINDGARKAWSGYAFEQVCLRHIEQIKKKLRIEDFLSDVSSWQTEGAQIDLVIERKDRIVNLCEMKYSEEPYSITKSYLKTMSDRRELFRQATKTTKAIHLTMVTPYGIKSNEQAKSIQSCVTLDDLYG